MNIEPQCQALWLANNTAGYERCALAVTLGDTMDTVDDLENRVDGLQGKMAELGQKILESDAGKAAIETAHQVVDHGWTAGTYAVAGLGTVFFAALGFGGWMLHRQSGMMGAMSRQNARNFADLTGKVAGHGARIGVLENCVKTLYGITFGTVHRFLQTLTGDPTFRDKTVGEVLNYVHQKGHAATVNGPSWYDIWSHLQGLFEEGYFGLNDNFGDAMTNVPQCPIN